VILTSVEKGRILEDIVELVLNELAFHLAIHLHARWGIKPPSMRVVIVARDDGGEQEPKIDFVAAISINDQLAIILLVECHNYAFYFVATDWTEKNTIRKFKRCNSLPELRFVAGHVYYTSNAQELLKANNITHIYVDQQVLSYGGEDFKRAVRQIRDQLVEQLEPHFIMHFVCRYLKPRDIKRLEKIDDLDKFNRALRRTISKRLKEADASRFKQLIQRIPSGEREAICRQAMCVSLRERTVDRLIDKYPLADSSSVLGGFNGSSIESTMMFVTLTGECVNIH
jgi:hypothetical protein